MRRHKAYTIIENDEVSEVIASALVLHPRIEDVFEALIWYVSRNPDCGTIVQHEGVSYRLVTFDPVKAAKNSTILAKYTVDDDVGEVTIHHAGFKLRHYRRIQTETLPEVDHGGAETSCPLALMRSSRASSPTSTPRPWSVIHALTASAATQRTPNRTARTSV